MQIVTLISDYGSNTYYAAALKARLLALMPQVTLVDISHQLPAYDLTQTAFLLQSCWQDFPEQTIHLVLVDTNLEVHKQLLIGSLGKHWIVTVDNGLLSMISDEWDGVYTLKQPFSPEELQSPDKLVFPKIAAILGNEQLREELLVQTSATVQVNNLKPVVESAQIRASIVHVDGYDNAITNLAKSDFDAWIGESNYRIFIKGKLTVNEIASNYAQVQPGDAVALFNDRGWLEVAINRGQGKSLLGLRLGDQIIIEKVND